MTNEARCHCHCSWLWLVVVVSATCRPDTRMSYDVRYYRTDLSREPSHSQIFPPYLSKYHSADTTGIRHHVASAGSLHFCRHVFATLTPKSGTHRFGRMEDRMAMNLLLFGARGEVSYLSRTYITLLEYLSLHYPGICYESTFTMPS